MNRADETMRILSESRKKTDTLIKDIVDNIVRTNKELEERKKSRGLSNSSIQEKHDKLVVDKYNDKIMMESLNNKNI